MFVLNKPVITALAALAPLAAADFHIGHTSDNVCFPGPTICHPASGVQIVPSNDFDSAYRLPNLVGNIDQIGPGTDSHINACGYTGVSIINGQGDGGSGQFYGTLLGDAGQSIGDCYWSDNAVSRKDGMSFVDKIICYSAMCGS